MDKALQHRLVGAGVIIALGVIIIPVVLDSAGERQLRKMPPEPTIVTSSRPGFISKEPVQRPANPESGQIIISLPEDKKTTPAVPADEPAAAIKTQKQTAEKSTPEKPPKVVDEVKTSPPPQTVTSQPSASSQTTARKTSSNWVVQVGSFTDQEKAVALRDTLRKKKFKAFVEQISGRNGQPLYRVRVGPLPTRDQTEKLAEQLQKSGYKGFITLHP